MNWVRFLFWMRAFQQRWAAPVLLRMRSPALLPETGPKWPYNSATLMANTAKSASGCLFVFATPFVLGGLFFAVVSYRSLDDPNFKNPVVGIGVGCALFVVGLLMMAAARGVFNAQTRLAAAKSNYPDQPWMWRPDWAAGRAPGLASKSLVLTWTATIFWNAISWAGAYSTFTKPARADQRFIHLFLSVFVVVGAGLLVWAALQTLRLLRFGRTVLQLQTLPAALGGKLQGSIDVPLPYPLPHGIQETFSCVNRVTTGSGKNRSTFDYIRWQNTKNVGAEQVMAGPSGSTIPVDFEVPRDMAPSDNSNPNNQVLWLVHAEADIPGANFDERYEVPVFRTRESPTIGEWESKQEVTQKTHAPSAPIRPTVLVSQAPEGGTQFYFPAARNKSAAAGVTLFAILFGGVLTAIFYLKAPLIFPIVFGFFDALMLLISLNLWFGTARIVANGDGVSLNTNTLGVRSSKHWDTSQIRDVQPKITMQSGEKAYYTATVTDSTGRDHSMGNAIADHNEAEWICSEIRQLANLETKSMSA
jgi:hypothetical protein